MSDTRTNTAALPETRESNTVRSVGTLFYDGVAIEMNDRTLSHVKIAIIQKMRRAESFTFSWVHSAEENPGRSTIWLHPSIPIRFEFENPVQPELNTRWIESILRSASTTGGILLTEEVIENGPPEPQAAG
jgi:hypothetical protein